MKVNVLSPIGGVNGRVERVANVFPLRKLVISGSKYAYINGATLFESEVSGYYVDALGNVYSSRRAPGKLAVHQLNGSRVGRHRYYTFSAQQVNAHYLMQVAKAHPDFTKETSEIAPEIAEQVRNEAEVDFVNIDNPATSPLFMSKTQRAASAVAMKGFVLATLQNDKLVFGTNPMFHIKKADALSEAERVAGLKPGNKIVVLRIEGAVTASGVKWE